ncbi:hypothetical protein [Leptospira levettii]|uniref:hypothetical protein n=1 Tax=Leptospira levettii TaxID=2023178 RepID=UPI000C299DCD|nr:hypothetical protein [Leptospira levettii]PKA25417.1 hypothetical protein CH381_15895 [Leptospira sp. mixed culture ATI2-C-A1]TGM83120.1 hypothetical protein EHR00_08405 [Leptospira levettii]TGM93712.1 hypothetical protein EHR02_13435 [Leptospira levettii]
MFRPHSLTLDGEGKEVFRIIKFQFPPIRTIPKKIDWKQIKSNEIHYGDQTFASVNHVFYQLEIRVRQNLSLSQFSHFTFR